MVGPREDDVVGADDKGRAAPFRVPAIDRREAGCFAEGTDGGPIEERPLWLACGWEAALEGLLDVGDVPDGSGGLPEEAIEPSRFTGDLLGDLTAVSSLHHRLLQPVPTPMVLDLADGLTPGVGLPALTLCLFLATWSRTLCRLEPPSPVIEGLDLPAVASIFPFVLVEGFGVGSLTMDTTVGLTNMPCPGSQSK